MFTPSQQGRQKLAISGFFYIRNKRWTTNAGNVRVYWNCECRRSTTCKSTVTTDDEGNVLRPPTAHNHQPAAHRVAVLDTMHRIRTDAAANLNDRPATIINEFVQRRVASYLPNVRNIRQTINRTRSKTLPAEPATSVNINLADDWARTLSGVNWSYDVMYNGDRYFMFTTEENLRILSVSSQWYADGTFKCVPPQFAQLYTIHGLYEERVLPLVYFLMRRRTVGAYEAVLGMLTARAKGELDIQLQPGRLSVDFELSAINAFRNAFGQQLQVQGCHFHLYQSVWREIQRTACKGLKNKTKTSRSSFECCLP